MLASVGFNPTHVVAHECKNEIVSACWMWLAWKALLCGALLSLLHTTFREVDTMKLRMALYMSANLFEMNGVCLLNTAKASPQCGAFLWSPGVVNGGCGASWIAPA